MAVSSVNGADPVKTTQVQEQKKGKSDVLASTLGLGAVGAGAGGWFGGKKPTLEQIFTQKPDSFTSNEVKEIDADAAKTLEDASLEYNNGGTKELKELRDARATRKVNIAAQVPENLDELEKKVSEAITTFLDKVGIGTKKATFSIDGEDFIAEIKGHGNKGTIWKITNSSGDSVAVKAFYDISLSGNCGLQEIATSWQATLDNVINVPKFYMANPASYDYVSESKYTNKPIWMMIDFIDKNKTAPKEGKMVYDWMKEYGMIHQDDQTILNGYLIDLGAIGASRGRLDDSGLLNILRMGYFKEN